MAKKYNSGVQWFLPNRKRPFATTTKATNDLIVYLSEDGGTVTEVKNSINYDNEAVAVLAHFEENGYGDAVLKTLVN